VLQAIPRRSYWPRCWLRCQ